MDRAAQQFKRSFAGGDNVKEVEIVDDLDWRPRAQHDDYSDEMTETEPGQSLEPANPLTNNKHR